MHDGAAVTVMVVLASLLSVWFVLWLGWVGFPKYHTILGWSWALFDMLIGFLSAFMLLSSCSSLGGMWGFFSLIYSYWVAYFWRNSTCLVFFFYEGASFSLSIFDLYVRYFRVHICPFTGSPVAIIRDFPIQI